MVILYHHSNDYANKIDLTPIFGGGYTLTDDSGVYNSTDGGATWTKILTTSNECRAIRLHPENHNMLFAVALDDGLQVSTDGGNTWTKSNIGLDTKLLTSCAVRGNKIYVGTQGCGVYSGDIDVVNGSVTWQVGRSNKPVPAVYNLQIKVDPTDSSRIFVGSNPGGLFRSDDGGDTFYDKNFLTPSVVVDDPVRQGYYTYSLNPGNPQEVWLGTWGKGVFKSYDGMDFDIDANGADHVMYGKHINAMLVHPSYGVLAATEEGVFRTTNGGETWTEFSDGLQPPQTRTLSVTTSGRLFCGTAGYELYFRQPTDSEWTQFPAFANWGTIWPIWHDRPLYQYTSQLFHRTDPNIIYMGTFPAGIFKTTDGGLSWREWNVGFLNDGVFYLVWHPREKDMIYAGTYNGLSITKDAGGHWKRWDSGWPGEQWVFSIDFDPRDPNVMYACSKNGENEGTGRPGFKGTVMKSTDGGAYWSEITNGLNIDREFYKIIVDPHQPDTVYLATSAEGVFISRDGGAEWSPWNDGLINKVAGTNSNNVTNCMMLSADGNYLYFGTSGSGIFRRITVAAISYPGRTEIIGTWSSGIWYYNVANNTWTKMYSNVPSGPIAAGDVTGDGRADVVSCWLSGLWYQNGATLGWTKAYGTAPSQVAAGDITGDVRAEVIGTWGTGIWYWNPATSLWTKMWSNIPSGQIGAGDVTGDGRADVVSCWPSGLWYQDGVTLAWTKVYSVAPSKIAVGDITGDGRAEIIGTWSTGIWYWNPVTSLWTKMWSNVPSGPIAAGDVTGNGRADVVSCWASGLWYQDGTTLGWTKVYFVAPSQVAVGDITGN